MSEESSMRDIRAQSMSATFDRVVWLDAAALSAIFAASQKMASDVQLVTNAAALLGLSLLITLCIPVWRAMVNARHVSRGTFRVAWEIYIAQLLAALITGVAIIMAIVGFQRAL